MIEFNSVFIDTAPLIYFLEQRRDFIQIIPNLSCFYYSKKRGCFLTFLLNKKQNDNLFF